MRSRSRSLIGALIALCLPTQLLAQSTPPCLTAKEAQAVIAFTLPDIMTSVASKCAPVTGPASFLSQSARPLAEKYRAASATAWPVAKPAIRKLAGQNSDLLDLLSDEALRALSAGFAATALVKDVEPRHCGDIDRILRAASPLPPENISMLMGILLEMMSRPKAQAALTKAKTPFILCPAPTGSGQPVTTK